MPEDGGTPSTLRLRCSGARATGYVRDYAPGAASLAVHWMLIEAGVPFAAVPVAIDTGTQRAPQNLALNPAWRVPTLMVEGVPWTESATLLMLLPERHPAAGLMPAADAPERAAWLETMVYLASTLLPAMRDWFYAGTDGDPAGADAVRAHARRRIEPAWDRLDAHQGAGRTHVIDDRLSTADLLATNAAPGHELPALTAFVDRMRRRPSFVEVSRREGLAGWPPAE